MFQLLGVKPKKKGNEISGIDQDELVDPSVLADSDSCFCEFNNVKIHHKISEAESPTQNATLDQGTSQITKYFPMILLHGFGASLFSWHRVMKQLAQIAGSKVLAFDRPAFGLTSRVSLQEHVLNNGKDTKPLNPYSMIFSVLATLHLIDFLAAEKAILVGHSAGSLVAVNAYFEAPERVAALILVAPAIIAPLIERKKYKQKKSAATQTQIKENSSKFAVNSNPFIGIYSILSKFLKYILQAIVNLVIGMKNLINSLYKKALSALLRSALAVMLVRFLINKFGITAVKNSWYDQNQVTEHILDGYTKPLKVKGWDTALAEYVAAMFSEFSSELKPLTANRLDEISCPVLIITGDSDRLVPSWNSVRLARAIPGSSLEIIEKCGHLPHEEKPEEFLLIIEKFLQSVLGGSNKPCI